MQYLETGRHNDAIAAFKSAIVFQKDHINSWNNLGLLYEDMSKGTTYKWLVWYGATMSFSGLKWMWLLCIFGKQHRLITRFSPPPALPYMNQKGVMKSHIGKALQIELHWWTEWELVVLPLKNYLSDYYWKKRGCGDSYHQNLHKKCYVNQLMWWHCIIKSYVNYIICFVCHCRHVQRSRGCNDGSDQDHAWSTSVLLHPGCYARKITATRGYSAIQ